MIDQGLTHPSATGVLDLPTQIGPYRILQVLGEGGMGVVYLAEQAEPFRRQVALKVIKIGMNTREVVARFQAERQALALMSHPHIAQIFGAGATEDGRPYFVMEHVPGVPITARLKLGGNPFSNRLRWYFGSSDDLRLNLSVQRFTADPSRAALEKYETNGNLRIPLVTLHTTADEVIPIWQELLYLPKVNLRERGRFIPIPAFRDGHCHLNRAGVRAAFALSVTQR